MSTGERIERRDLEAKLQELQGEVSEAADSARSYAVVVGVVAGVVVVGLAFVLGRRSGHRRSTVVEIRRV
jgi:hypothetical protein